MRAATCGVFLLALGCAQTGTFEPSTEGVQERDIVAALREGAIALQEQEAPRTPIFEATERVYTTAPGGELHVYTFSSADAAAAAASTVSPDGSGVGTTLVTWIAPPHFFRDGRIIVNYLGTSEDVLNILRREMGPPFAGRIPSS